MFQDSTISQWTELREDYNRMERFCKCVNDVFGILILVIFTSNLGVILIQLFHCLKNKRSGIGKVYLLYSMIYVIFKVMNVSLYGSCVTEESQKPLKYLYLVPQRLYNVEVRG